MVSLRYATLAQIAAELRRRGFGAVAEELQKLADEEAKKLQKLADEEE